MIASFVFNPLKNSTNTSLHVSMTPSTCSSGLICHVRRMQRLRWPRIPTQWMHTQAIHVPPSRSFTTCTPRLDVTTAAKSKFSGQRLRALGGHDSLSAYFPRLEPGPKAITAAQFLALQPSNSTGDNAYTVYGIVVRLPDARVHFLKRPQGV